MGDVCQQGMRVCTKSVRTSNILRIPPQSVCQNGAVSVESISAHFCQGPRVVLGPA